MNDRETVNGDESVRELKRDRYRGENIGSGYDCRYRGGINQLNTIVERAWIVRRLADGPLLDAGAGTGRFSAYFAGRGFQVTALDSSEDMLAALGEKSPDVETVQGDLYEIPFETGRFANAVCMHVLFHLPDWQRVAGELLRVLRPGGRLFFEMRSGEHVALFRRLAGGLGMDPESAADPASATIHLTTGQVRHAIENSGGEITARLRYDLPHSYWMSPLSKPAEILLEKSVAARSFCSAVELALGRLLPCSLAYRTLYEVRKR